MLRQRIRVAVLGTVGVPARYGGFETLVDNLIGKHRSDDIAYTVFCSSKNLSQFPKSYKGARLRYIPLKANGAQSLIYDSISLVKSMRDFDIILYLGASVPLYTLIKRFCRGKIVLNIDGLDQERDKYSGFQKRYLSYVKDAGIRNADEIVADNKAIQDYVTDNFGRESRLIAYGGDQVLVDMTREEQNEILKRFTLSPGKYAIALCRIEPENNCHTILEAAKRTNQNLIFIGNWDNSDYGRNLKEKYSPCKNIIVQDSIYDIDILYALRNNASMYIHGHRVGGTNPSLVEAMFFGIPVICYDVIYNRQTTYGQAVYFKDLDELCNLISSQPPRDGVRLRELAFRNYTWETIVHNYEDLFRHTLQK